MREKLERAITDYERDGVAKIPSVFTVEEVSKIRARTLMALTKSGVDNKYRSGGRLQVSKAGGPALMFWPSLIDEYLNDVRCDKRVAIVARAFLGDEVKQLNNQTYFRLPLDGDAFAYHQDIMFRKGMSEHFDSDDYLQTIIAIDPVNMSNGGIDFVLGSHRCDDLDLCSKGNLRYENDAPVIFENEEAEHPLPTKTFHAEPGDMLVWNVMTIHGSLKNESFFGRMTYMNGFCRSKACKVWPVYLDNGNPVREVDTEAIPYE